MQWRSRPPQTVSLCLSLALVTVLSACAPSEPLRRGESSASRAIEVGSGTEAQQRLAVRASERADDDLRAIRRLMQDNMLTTEETLNRLSAFTINELRWQQREHQGNAPLSAWIDLALQVQSHKLDPRSLEVALTDWTRRWRSVNDAATQHSEQARIWVARWRQQAHGPQRIGVILPGESSLRLPGEMIKRGLLDAWLAQPVSQRVSLYFYYADDQDLGSLYQAAEQAKKNRVDWLIGPLPREQVEHILMNRSARWMMPTLFLNTPRPEALVDSLGGQRLAFALTPEEDARQAALLAHRLGFDRALVLAQDTAWGDRIASTFTDTFKSLGRQVTDEARYDESRVDHSVLLESVLGLNESKERIAGIESLVGQPIQAEPQRRSDIDMIFLASRASDARQIRPQLQFFRADDLPVVTTAHATDGAIDSRRDVDLEGVYLPMAPWFINDTAAGKLRIEAGTRYSELGTPSLSHLYAMGQDLALIMRWLRPMQSDPDLRVMGNTGELWIAPTGQVQRQLSGIQVVNGQSRIISP